MDYEFLGLISLLVVVSLGYIYWFVPWNERRRMRRDEPWMLDDE